MVKKTRAVNTVTTLVYFAPALVGQGYNAKCGKYATAILRNGDAEQTLKLTLTLILTLILTRILTLFHITIPQNTRHRLSAFRTLPLPAPVIPTLLKELD